MRIDKEESCDVSFSGDTLTIHDSGGIGDRIVWLATVTDGSGNTTQQRCGVKVVRR